MATATKKTPTPTSGTPASPSQNRSGILAAIDAIYRFLASLKLAVLSLGTLAGVLAYATFFESWHGSSAVQEWIYQTKWFALLLAFLGVNILCAALIRYPWKKRQTGFVITHAGLLILLAGSFYSLKTADEGQVGMAEGESRGELVRLDYPVIRVVPIDKETGKPANEEYRLSFRPGNFAWGPGNPRPRGFATNAFHTLTGGLFDSRSKDGEVLTSPVDPIEFKVKSHLPASAWTVDHVPDPAGVPMVRLRVEAKMPGAMRAMDAFENEREEARWLAPPSDTELQRAYRRLNRVARRKGPALFAFNFVDRPELVADFLNPPKDSGPTGVARLRYQDKDGKPQTYEWKLDGQTGKSVTLPGSDITATLEKVAQFDAGLEELLGEPDLPIAQFKVKRGDGPEATYYGWARMPMVPSLMPAERDKGASHKESLVEISYFLPPELGTGRTLGLVEILGTPDGSLYHRVFGRGDQGVAVVRSVGPLEKGKSVVAFGGNPNMPMTLKFAVDEYLTAGRTEPVCEAIAVAKGQQGTSLAASKVAMTVKGPDGPVTKEFWIRRSPTFEPIAERVTFPTGQYDVYYDVDRRPLDFSLKLDDFKVGFDPGTQQASSFVSQVRLTDEGQGIRARPYTISMNEPLSHRGFTFYQSSYTPEVDPRTGRETGRFQSIFQVGIDPGRTTKYAGCVLIVLGAFVQFYMRAGLFSDGGKRERAVAARAAQKRAERNGTSASTGGNVEIVTESEETL